MDNDSPNLFDSEPLTVELQVAADHSLLGELNEADGVSVTGNLGARTDVEDLQDTNQDYQYQTDESDDNDEAVDDPPEMDSVDQPPGESSVKTKEVHHKGLPPGRVKLIMKMDPDVNIVAGEAVFLLTKATVSTSAYHCSMAAKKSNRT